MKLQLIKRMRVCKFIKNNKLVLQNLILFLNVDYYNSSSTNITL